MSIWVPSFESIGNCSGDLIRMKVGDSSEWAIVPGWNVGYRM